MKSVIAASQISTFASQFRRNILLWDGTSVPINSISFVITGSGNNKDSSVNAAKKCFSEGYNTILEHRQRAEIKRAIAAACNADEDPALARTEEIYSKYMRPIPPIDIMPTTGPGLIQHINDISDLDITAGSMYAGEFSDELAYNPDMMENIKILSEVYDLGIKATKYTKGVEHRSKAINGQAVSALFVGSPGHILYDEATKKKFHIAFMSVRTSRKSATNAASPKATVSRAIWSWMDRTTGVGPGIMTSLFVASIVFCPLLYCCARMGTGIGVC